MDYVNDQEQEEAKEDIKHPNVMLEEAEKQSIKDFLSPAEDLGQQEEDLMTESSNETIGSCDFKIDNLNVFAGIVEDNPSYGIV